MITAKQSWRKNLPILVLIILGFGAALWALLTLLIGDSYTSGIIALILMFTFEFIFINKAIILIEHGQIGLIIREDKIEDELLLPGKHLILPFREHVELFSNDKKLKTDKYEILHIATNNKTYLDFTIQVIWLLVDPKMNYGHSSDQIRNVYFANLNKTMSNYINNNEINNDTIFKHKGSLETELKTNLNNAVQSFGESIYDVTIISIIPQDKDWIIIWKNQSEMDYFIERVKKTASSQNTTPEEAFRQIAIKEGWIKSAESIYTIKDAEKVILKIKNQ